MIGCLAVSIVVIGCIYITWFSLVVVIVVVVVAKSKLVSCS